MTPSPRIPVVILLVDDDEEDLQMTLEALRESRLGNDLRVTRDGEELMDYLLHRGAYADPADAPMPGLILLDLNMPKKDGREALGEIKSRIDLKVGAVEALLGEAAKVATGSNL